MSEAATTQAIWKITELGIYLYGVDEEVEKLVTELRRMQCFLKDFDSRRQTEERVRNWAHEIRVLAQDAESIVSKYAAEVRQIRGEGIATAGIFTILFRFMKETMVRSRIKWEIGKINKRIRSLTESLNTYGIHGINEEAGDQTSANRSTTITTDHQVTLAAIAVERWGGRGGSRWSYRPKGLVKQIVVRHGAIVDSLTFKSIEENGCMETSQTFGGSGGHLRTEINVDCPSEYLRGISGTFGLYGTDVVIKSIKFHTNLRNHGPVGSKVNHKTDHDTTSFSFIMQGGVVIGFHGLSGTFLDAIGLYVVPERLSLHSQPS